MLYKNDEQYKLDPKEIASVKEFFHNKFPVEVVYPPDRIVKSRLPHNRLPDQPNSISFDLKSTVKALDGAEVWRYADDIIYDKNGKRKYLPRKFRFAGTRYLDLTDIDLIFFLLRKSEYRYISDDERKENPKLKQSRQPKFMFKDLITEADRKVEKKATESKITTLLYNPDLGLSEEKIRQVAKAYFIKSVDDLSLSQVKILLETKIGEKKTGGPEKFFRMVNADEEIDARSSIQAVIDMNFIRYDTAKGSWFWNTEGENGKSQICKVSKNDVPVEVLYNLYVGDVSFKEEIKALVMTKQKKTKKTTQE